ncbi:hypothetical protein BDW68DRAFT_165133 [Aspergillus falconensis]
MSSLPNVDTRAINQLPWEVIRTIIRFLPVSDLANIALVCRYSRSVVLPELYHSIFLDAAPGERLDQLHRHLGPSASPLKYCRRFYVIIGGEANTYGRNLFKLKNLLVSGLRNVEYLTLHQGSSRRDLNFWKQTKAAVRHMQALRSLRLVSDEPFFHVSDIMRALRKIHAPLCTLAIDGVKTPPADSKKYLGRNRTAPFTSLRLERCFERPEVVQRLINWPKALVGFRFVTCDPDALGLPKLGKWLSIHRQTLEEIDIRSVALRGNGHLFNLSTFVALKTLTLSQAEIHCSNGRITDDDVGLLLAPNLNTFRLDYSLDGRHLEFSSDFGDPEEQFIRKLAQAAILRKSGLRTIEIVFDPELSRSQAEDRYPWDRIDRLDEEVQAHGIRVVYPRPALSREEWFRALAERTGRKPRKSRRA